MLALEKERLLAQAESWIEQDPDPACRAEIRGLVQQGAWQELAVRFSGPLEFGTAGLRGIVGAGETRMNRAVVLRTTRGLCTYLEQAGFLEQERPIVVGWDARLTSETYAKDTINVMRGAGFSVYHFREPMPTPLVAYAVRKFEAAGGVVITASHNPKEYNGYKVYDARGVQLTPPADAIIAEHIARAGRADRILASAKLAQERGCGRLVLIEASFFEAYLEQLMALRPGKADPALSIVYTPLHGVGGKFMQRALARAGYTRVAIAQEQAVPDGSFPTLESPNPEHGEALECALKLARKRKADLVLAHDPDADRLAVAVRAGGEYARLTGNEIGLLLADYLLKNYQKPARPLVVSSIVSSPMLDSLAQSYGARVERTLTGFKWMYTAALELARGSSVEPVFCFEEALGYGIGTLVHDKDGLSSGVIFADLASSLAKRGETVVGELARLYQMHGLWLSVQHNLMFDLKDAQAQIHAGMQRLRANLPTVVAGTSVHAVVDYAEPSVPKRPAWLGRSDLVELKLEDKSRILLRPSGTEPKLKLYIDICKELESGPIEAQRAILRERALAFIAELSPILEGVNRLDRMR